MMWSDERKMMWHIMSDRTLAVSMLMLMTALPAFAESSSSNAETLTDLQSSNELQLDVDAVNVQELDGEHGKSDLKLQFQVNDSEQNAVLKDNSLNNSITGDNSISDNALSGASGISTVIQNTGNQVIIQGTTMVNVLINP